MRFAQWATNTVAANTCGLRGRVGPQLPLLAPGGFIALARVSGGIIGIHFRRDKREPAAFLINGWAHFTDRAGAGDLEPNLFPAGANQSTAPPPAPSTGSTELKSRSCRALGFGRSEHQAFAVVGVVLVGIAITERPFASVARLSVHKTEHQRLARRWHHSAALPSLRREKL
jgi:hypothetical protein